ncbi:MAG TPA: hypothetical protein DCR62_04795 [Acholeplasmatales bacterium]|jgi:hypothetical protein|nr:hypothetical protein [Bacilli bacterium]MBS6562252.1 hypothetical protein [Staphylococcus sp.]CDC70168.1 unknown [Staphylococcus sp. CAG:324]HAR58044.1 hypothetical protein [Acholeplasmatales bacterium]
MQNDKNIRKTIPEPLMFIHTVSTPILSNGSKKYYDSREASNKTNASTIPTIIPDEVLLERNRGRTIDRLLYQKIQNIIQMYEKGHPIPCLIETRNNESFEGVPTKIENDELITIQNGETNRVLLNDIKDVIILKI